MRRSAIAVLSLTGLLGLAACNPPTTNVPAGQYGDSTQQSGEAVIVGSLSTLGLTGVADGKRLTFVDYDVGQKNHWPIAKSPLAVLLSPQPDLDRIAHSDDYFKTYDLRVTWQAAQKHKIVASFGTQRTSGRPAVARTITCRLGLRALTSASSWL